jgi:cyclohexa-1,5-dienecarbonyl-CoA hydratase
MADRILVEPRHDGQVVRLVLNAPKANVLDAAMMEELHAAFAALRDRPETKLLEFRGAGAHFSFGASVPEHVREKAPGMLDRFHGLFDTLADLCIPTLALVSGQCLGGGMELALMCTVLHADATARFGQPEIVLGVFPPPASILLPMKVGQARADELLVSGRTVTAEEGRALGFVHEVFPDAAALEAGTDAWIERHILPKSASSLRYAVAAARIGLHRALRERLRTLERIYLDDLMATHDANEGIAAFLEKRPPVWTHS